MLKALPQTPQEATDDDLAGAAGQSASRRSAAARGLRLSGLDPTGSEPLSIPLERALPRAATAHGGLAEGREALEVRITAAQGPVPSSPRSLVGLAPQVLPLERAFTAQAGEATRALTAAAGVSTRAQSRAFACALEDEMEASNSYGGIPTLSTESGQYLSWERSTRSWVVQQQNRYGHNDKQLFQQLKLAPGATRSVQDWLDRERPPLAAKHEAEYLALNVCDAQNALVPYVGKAYAKANGEAVPGLLDAWFALLREKFFRHDPHAAERLLNLEHETNRRGELETVEQYLSRAQSLLDTHARSACAASDRTARAPRLWGRAL